MNEAVIEKLDAAEARYRELERRLAEPDASKAPDAKKLWGEYRSLRRVSGLYADYRKFEREAVNLRELADDNSEPELAELAREELAAAKAELKRLEEEIYLALTPKDEFEDADAIVEIRAGAGGGEAGIFAADLRRMYYRYAELQRWKVEDVNSMESGIGSIKETVFQVSGKGAYEKLSAESGVHRVQRVPQTESQGRIHTSTATVAVLPKVEQTELEIDESDIKMDIFHASGHGGQNVNKVATAVRLTHLPSKLVVVCQNERSQIQNRRQAMEVLRARLWEDKTRRERESQAAERRSQIGGGDRSEKARTYNFPQNRVTDHRIGYTSHNMRELLDGDLEELVGALLAARRAEMLARVSN